jgi:hypothetical protein
MTPAQGIEKLGFRRWYERQLIEGHVHFITCFLCMILIAVALDQIDWHGPVLQQIFVFAALIGSGVLCVTSLRRYSFLLVRAEMLGSQSSCKQCSAYGVLQVLGAGESEVSSHVRGTDNSWIWVRCKKCGHDWRMDNT